MDFKVFLSEEALNDLEQIVAYIAPHNLDAAARMGNRLLDAALALSSFLERGRVVPRNSNAENSAKRCRFRIESSTGSRKVRELWRSCDSGTRPEAFHIFLRSNIKCPMMTPACLLSVGI
jgi:plasmid stabilization system protein ParE